MEGGKSIFNSWSYLNHCTRQLFSSHFQHPTSGITLLMAASGHGNLDLVIEIVTTFRAKIDIKAQNGWSALDFAKYQGQDEVHEYLKEAFDQDFCAEKKEVLENYHLSFNDDLIDYQLIVALIHYLHQSLETNDAILVFLPGM